MNVQTQKRHLYSLHHWTGQHCCTTKLLQIIRINPLSSKSLESIHRHKPLLMCGHPVHAALHDKVTAEILAPLILTSIRIVHSVPAVNHRQYSAISWYITISMLYTGSGWLGSRVVSVLHSDTVGPGFKSQSRRCRVTHTRLTALFRDYPGEPVPER